MGYDPDFPQAKRYQVDAIHAIVTGNNLKYPESELYKAGRSLSFRDLSIDHYGLKNANGELVYPKTPYARDLPKGENGTIRAEYLPEVKGVRTVFRVSDPDVIKAIEAGQIKRVSIEAEGVTNCNMGGVCERQNLIFTKLTLIWGLAQAGDQNAVIQKVGEAVTEIPKENLIADCLLISPMVDNTPAKDDKPTKTGESITAPAGVESPTASAPAMPETPTASAPASAPAPATAPAGDSGGAKPEPAKPTEPTFTKADIDKAINEAVSSVKAETKKEIDSLRENLKNSVTESNTMTETANAIPEKMPAGKDAPAITGEALIAKRNDTLASRVRSNDFITKPDITGEAVHGSADGANANAVGKVWTTDFINLPAGLVANLRQIAETKTIPQGNDTVKFFTITTPLMREVDANDAGEGSDDSDDTNTIAMIEVSVKFYTARQTVTWKAQQLITGDVISAIERGFAQSALLNEDKLILASLDAVTVGNFAGVIYGDGSVASVGTITAAMTLTEDRFLEAIAKILGADFPAIGLTAVIHSKQLGDLMKRNSIKDASQSGDGGLFNRNGSLTGRYGISIRVSNQVANATDGASSARTYKSYVVTDGQTCALAIAKELAVESFRDIKGRGTVLRSWCAMGAGVKVAKTAVKIITA